MICNIYYVTIPKLFLGRVFDAILPVAQSYAETPACQASAREVASDGVHQVARASVE